MQQLKDQSINKKDVPGQYLDIDLVAGQYKIYCPAMAFDPPTQSVTFIYCNTAARDLTDIYARLPRVRSARGRVQIYQ